MKHIGTAFLNQALLDAESIQDRAESLPCKTSRKEKLKRHKPYQRRTEQYKTIDISLGEDAHSTPFCSRSEAICAELLERFVPNFRVIEGVTFQVPISIDDRGNVLAVDFFVDGVFLEYHPARFFKNKKGYGDFSTKEEYKAYTRLFHSLGKNERDFIHAAVRARLKDNYYKRRRAILDRHPVYRRAELVVATSPEELYYLVICRFGSQPPKSVERFLQLFEELRETLP